MEQTFTVAANMPDGKVRKAFREAIGKDSRILTDSEPSIRLKSFDSMNAIYIVSVPCMSKDYYEVSYSIVENVHASFVKHSIEMGTEMFGMRSSGPNGSSGGSGQQPGGAEGGRSGSGQQHGSAEGGRGRSEQQRGGTDGGEA